MRSTFRLAALVCSCVAFLAGCQGFNPVTDTAGHFFQSGFTSAKPSYTAGFEYLEVEWQGRKTALALGYRDQQPGRVTEYWYSGQGELLKLHNGRMVEVIGMTHEVRSTTTGAPNWAELMSQRAPVVWTQIKDAMPGYRYGLQEFVISQSVEPTKGEAALLKEWADWVLEEVKSKRDDGRVWIYRQKFALQGEHVVYSEQCLAPEMCFKLKPLGVVVKP